MRQRSTVSSQAKSTNQCFNYLSVVGYLLLLNGLVSATEPTLSGSLKSKHVTSLSFKMTPGSLDLSFSIPQAKASNRLIFAFLQGDYQKTLKKCPSFAYWFKKDLKDKECLSVAAGCLQNEEEPKMRWKLADDWHREKDEIDNDGIWHFKGKRVFKESLELFEFLKFKNIRVINQGDDSQETDENIEIKDLNRT